MSQLGNITQSYGSSFEIAIANTTSENVINASILPPNTIIIAAPQTDNEDAGTFSMIVTDANKTPSRLTYNISLGNGITAYNDQLMLNIDDNVLLETSNDLDIDIIKLSYNSSIAKKNNKLSISIDGMPKVSSKKQGVFKIDNFTIKSNNGTLYVDTNSLDLASSNSSGICIGDKKTIYASNGELNIINSGLDKCSSTKYGLAKTDGTSIVSVSGSLSISESYLISDTDYSLVKTDNNTIISSNGILSVNQNGLTKASTSTYGVVSVGNEFTINSNGQLVLNETANVNTYIVDLQNRIDNINSQLDDIENELN